MADIDPSLLDVSRSLDLLHSIRHPARRVRYSLLLGLHDTDSFV